MLLKAEGVFDAIVLPSEHYLAKVGEKETPSVVLPLEIAGGAFKGQTITAFLSLNETIRQGGKFAGQTNREAAEATLRKAFGWNGDWYALQRGEALEGLPCRIKVEKDDYRSEKSGEAAYKVAFVWPPNSGIGEPLSDDDMARLFGGRPAQAATRQAQPAATSSADDLPF